VYCDRRIANVQKWWLTPPEDADMRVPDVIKKCVVFLGRLQIIRGNFASLSPEGTGFLVGVPSEFDPPESGQAFHYLVTAKHVIDGLVGAESGARMNRKDGGTEIVGLSGKWWFHPSDPTADVAVTPVGMDVEAVRELDLISFPAQGFATQSAIDHASIGVGDEVFITGLFAHNLNSGPNMPIVRMGNISLMAGKPIQAGDTKMEAHLIEARSIGGLSGSPAFVRQTISIGFADPKHFEEHELYRQLRPDELEVGPASPLWITGVGPFYLLGLMHGHWDISAKEKNKILVTEDQFGMVNMGIALVVPAQKILDTIDHPELKAMRRDIQDKIEAQKKKASRPKQDSLSKNTSDSEIRDQLTPQGARIAIPTRGQFERDLAKAIRKRDK
jgi:hypothetical protein